LKFWGVRLASILGAVAFCFLLEGVAQGQSSFVQRLFVLAGLYVTLAVSLNLINGITGQFSIGHAAFYQVGAYTAGFCASRFFAQLNLPPPAWLLLMMITSAITAGLAGLLVGLPSLRLKGDYLAIVTLGFGEIIRIFAQNQEALGGAYGLTVAPKIQYVWAAWLLAILCIAVCRNLLRTAHGLPFLAVREDEIASSAMGVNVTQTKVVAFVLGSMFAGAAGAILAHFESFVSPPMFTMDVSFTIVTMVVLGGTGSITGSVLAAILLFYLPEKMRDFTNIPLSGVAAAFVAISAAVFVIRWVMQNFHGSAKDRAIRYLGILVGAVVIWFLSKALLGNVPSLKENIDGSKLRMVVFSVTLVVLMLLRPQGMLGHHEFSWDWVRNKFGKPAVKEATA
jgi:branched-chain amino acid transport system permease protein